MTIPDLTPEQIAACLEAHISKSKFCPRPIITWRTVALNLKISPQRVLKHFAPDELDKYQQQLKRLKKPDAPKCPRVWRQITPEDMKTIINTYRAGFSAMYTADRLPDGIGRKRVARIFATLGGEHGAARKAAKNTPPVSRKKSPVSRSAAKRKLVEYGVCPKNYYKSEREASHRPPPWAVMDRDKRATLRYQSTDPNVFHLGDPVFEQSALYKKLQQQSAGGTLGIQIPISQRSKL